MAGICVVTVIFLDVNEMMLFKITYLFNISSMSDPCFIPA